MTVLRELELACEGALAVMLRTAFGNTENVSGQSAYVTDLTEAILTVANLARENIETKKYLRNLYDKTAKCVPITTHTISHDSMRRLV